jgi:hypothetical protein
MWSVENPPNDGQAFERFTALEAVFPLTNPAGAIVRSNAPLVTFPRGAVPPDPGDAIDIHFEGSMDANYDGGPFSIDLYWLAATAVAGDVEWVGAIARQDDGDALNRPFATAIVIVSTAPAVNGDIQRATLAFTNADADSISAGNPYRLRIRRNGASGADTMDDTAQLLRVTVQE